MTPRWRPRWSKLPFHIRFGKPEREPFFGAWTMPGRVAVGLIDSEGPKIVELDLEQARLAMATFAEAVRRLKGQGDAREITGTEWLATLPLKPRLLEGPKA